MTVRLLLCAFALLLLTVVLGGCGGDSAPALIAGDYFPLTIGMVWDYSTRLEAETPSESFSTTGTMKRTLVGTQVIVVGGSPVNTYVFQHDYTAAAPPTIVDPDLAPFINEAFSPTGGLQSVRAYYRVAAATPDKPTHLQLVALSTLGGSIIPMGPQRPFLFNPPFHGTNEQVSFWFTPLPLMPFPTQLSDMQVQDKVLTYGVLSGIGGTANAVISIYFYSGALNVGGDVASIAGRGRSFFKDGVGLWGGVNAELTDWYMTINKDGKTSRVTSRMELVSITP